METPAAAPETFFETPPAAVPPSCALYSPNQVVLAGFLGTPAAAATLLFVNYRRQGRARDATVALVVGIVATAAMVGLGFVLPDRMGNFLPIAVVLSLRQWAKTEQPAFDAHVA